MSMTIKEAIRRIRNHMGVHGIGQYPHIHICEALNMAITALREQEERENPKLLTMDELKKMNGEPVWVAELNYWAIVEVLDSGTWAGVPFVYTHIDDVGFGWNAESRNLHCYRHKPKEDVK